MFPSDSTTLLDMAEAPVSFRPLSWAVTTFWCSRSPCPAMSTPYSMRSSWGLLQTSCSGGGCLGDWFNSFVPQLSYAQRRATIASLHSVATKVTSGEACKSAHNTIRHIVSFHTISLSIQLALINTITGIIIIITTDKRQAWLVLKVGSRFQTVVFKPGHIWKPPALNSPTLQTN